LLRTGLPAFGTCTGICRVPSRPLVMSHTARYRYFILFQVEPLIEDERNVGMQPYRICIQRHLHLFGVCVDGAAITVQNDRGDPERDFRTLIYWLLRKRVDRQ